MPLLALGAAVLYAAGVRRVGRRGRRWPAARTAVFGAGVAAMVLSALGDDTARFSVHAVEHVVLAMVAPPLLALGAPVTLALQAADRPARTALLGVLHGRVATALAHPVTGGVVFGTTLFVLYLTPLFGWSLRSGAVHAAVHLHFLAAGCAFAWPLVGVDPLPRRAHPAARLLAVLLLVPVHAVLGLALLQVDEVLGGGGWSLDDQRAGVAVLWATGELFALALGAVVAVQWVRADERAQAREDRRLDADAAGKGNRAPVSNGGECACGNP